MTKWWLGLLLLGVFASTSALASQERIDASIVRIKVTDEESTDFYRILKSHYDSMRAMIERELQSVSAQDLSKDIDRRARFINDSTAKKMAKVLRPDQMDELRYLLNLIADDFKAQNGITD